MECHFHDSDHSIFRGFKQAHTEKYIYENQKTFPCHVANSNDFKQQRSLTIQKDYKFPNYHLAQYHQRLNHEYRDCLSQI